MLERERHGRFCFYSFLCFTAFGALLLRGVHEAFSVGLVVDELPLPPVVAPLAAAPDKPGASPTPITLRFLDSGSSPLLSFVLNGPRRLTFKVVSLGCVSSVSKVFSNLVLSCLVPRALLLLLLLNHENQK